MFVYCCHPEQGEDSAEGSSGHSGNLRGFFDSQQGISIGMLAPGKHDDWKIRCALQHAQNAIRFLKVRLLDKSEFEFMQRDVNTMEIIEQRYNDWKQHGCAGEMTQEEKTDAFYQELEFGTGGLRGKLGQGTNRMNFQTVGRATFGLAAYLCKYKAESSAVIGYDSRKYSREFAHLAAGILSSKGVRVYLFEELMPTPVVSFAVRTLGTDTGIVITASHNPKVYNGYKVYNEKGCQITDQAAREIIAQIQSCGYFTDYTPDETRISYLGKDMLQSFIRRVRECSLYAVTPQTAPRMVYTPLNGTGRKPVAMLLEQMGIRDVHVVPEQEQPDCEFTTCPFPNPEEDSALTLAYRDAEACGAELILATDPDADRVGVAARREDGAMHRLTGNEVGLLLLEYVLARKQETGTLPQQAAVVKTIVTSDLGTRIAGAYGVEIKDVLTGFKYIGEQIDLLSREDQFLFGFEESCGYLIGPYTRDKDAMGAVMLLVEAAAWHKAQGRTLLQAMDRIYETYGYMETSLQSILFEGPQGAAEKDALISRIRQAPPQTIGGKAVTAFIDYRQGVAGLPKSNVMSFAGADFKFIVRPSGTEPKLKIYYFAGGSTRAAARENLALLRTQVEAMIYGGNAPC